jgi:hypothetical protein
MPLGYEQARDATEKLFQMYKEGQSWDEVGKWLSQDIYKLAPGAKASGTEPEFRKQ